MSKIISYFFFFHYFYSPEFRGFELEGENHELNVGDENAGHAYEENEVHAHEDYDHEVHVENVAYLDHQAHEGHDENDAHEENDVHDDEPKMEVGHENAPKNEARVGPKNVVVHAVHPNDIHFYLDIAHYWKDLDFHLIHFSDLNVEEDMAHVEY